MSTANRKLEAGRPSAGKSQKTLAAATARVNFDLDRDQHTKLKVYAAKQGKTVKEVLSDYVAQLPD